VEGSREERPPLWAPPSAPPKGEPEFLFIRKAADKKYDFRWFFILKCY